MIEPERFWGKYIIQHPLENNCVIIALANALIDFGILKTEKSIDRFIKRWTKCYNVNKHGLQPTMIGHMMFQYGVESSLMLSPREYDIIRNYDENVKVLRVCSIPLNKPRNKEYDQWLLNFAKKYNVKLSDKKLITFILKNEKGEYQSYTSHAFYSKDFQENGSFTAINYDGITKQNWWNIGHYYAKLGKAIGSEFVMIIKKQARKYDSPCINEVS